MQKGASSGGLCIATLSGSLGYSANIRAMLGKFPTQATSKALGDCPNLVTSHNAHECNKKESAHKGGVKDADNTPHPSNCDVVHHECNKRESARWGGEGCG